MPIKGSTFSVDSISQRSQVPDRTSRRREKSPASDDAVALREGFGKSKQADDSREQSQQVNNTRGKRKRIQDEITAPQPKPVEAAPKDSASIQPTPAEPKPVSEVTKPEPQDTSIKSLSARYVQQYEQQSGKTLSDTERSSLEAEVQDFYSEPSRAGRLEQIVFERAKAQ